MAALEKAKDGKKEEEVPQADKDKLEELRKKIDDCFLRHFKILSASDSLGYLI